jgi:hypothetical protein
VWPSNKNRIVLALVIDVSDDIVWRGKKGIHGLYIPMLTTHRLMMYAFGYLCPLRCCLSTGIYGKLTFMCQTSLSTYLLPDILNLSCVLREMGLNE